MEPTHHIQLTSEELQTRFEWSGFDGDDCFSAFQITVTADGQSRLFEFGPCAAAGLRKMIRFFSDSTQDTVGLGFRHPDIRHCDVHRLGDDYRFVVRFEGSGLHEEFHLYRPTLQIGE
jgi:hypothetical protein